MKTKDWLVILLLRVIPGGLAALWLICSVHGATYYVDPEAGNDSNAGTSTGAPFAHIPGDQGATGSASFTPSTGDLIVVKGGTTYMVATNNIVDLNQHGVTYLGGHLHSTPWGSSKPVIDCSNTKPSTDAVNGVFSSVSKSNLTIRGFRFTGGNYDDSYNAAISWRGTGGTYAGLLVDDCDFDNITESGILIWGSWDAGTASSQFVVTNCTFQDIGTHGVFLRYGLTGVSVLNCTFDNIGWRTDSPGPGGDPIAVFGHDSPSWNSDLLVRGCTFGGVPIKSWVILSDQNEGAVFERNHFHGATGYAGFDINGRGTNITIRNNLFDGRVTNYYGLVTVDTDQGTGVSVDGLALHNNLLRGSAANNGLVFIGRGTSTSTEGVYNLDIRNNIVVSTNAGTVLYLEANSAGTATFCDLDTLTVDYNTWSGSATPFHAQGINYSFANWQSTFSQDANSHSGSPAFASGGGFMPALTDTAAKGAGVDLSGSFTGDYYGRTRSAWDIGPFAVTGNRYVSKAGSDSNSGLSEEDAWLTVAMAAASIAAGETAIIGAGTYAEAVTINGTDGTEANPKRFVGSGTPSITSFTVYDPWVEINGVEVSNTNGTTQGVYFQTGASHCTLANCLITAKGIGVRVVNTGVDDLRIVRNRFEKVNKGMSLYGVEGGTGHLVASNEVWRPTQWIAGYDTDYMRLLSGPNHRIVHNLFHGATTNSVNTADGVAHVDGLQVYAESGRPACTNVLFAWNTVLDAMACIQFTDSLAVGHGSWTIVSNLFGRGLAYHYTGELQGQSPINMTAAAGTMTVRRNTFFGMGSANVFLNCSDIDFEENVCSDVGTGYSFTGTTPGTGLRNVTWPSWSPDTGTGDTTNNPALRNTSNPIGRDGVAFTWDDGARPGSASSAIGLAADGGDVGAYQHETSLLVITEPTARGYLGPLLDDWAAQVRREGNWERVEIREATRLTGVTGAAADRWAAINVVSNLIEGTQPDAVQLVGGLPWHIGGLHNMDGHYVRCETTDAPLMMGDRTFTDSSTSFSSATSVLATNIPGDGRYDAVTWDASDFTRPVARVDFSSIGAKSGTWSGGCLDGLSKLPAITESTALVNYFTTNLLYRRQGFSLPATAKLTGLFSWTDGLRVSNVNNTLTWAYSSSTSLGGTTNRVVYSSYWYDEFDDMVDGSCNVMKCLLHVVYKSYGFEHASVANGNSELFRWMAHGMSLASGWSKSASQGASYPFWRIGASDVTLSDSIATSVSTYGSMEDFYWLAGDLTLPVDTITQAPARRVTIGTATIGAISGP